jgi:hypothetical protein
MMAVKAEKVKMVESGNIKRKNENRSAMSYWRLLR